MKIKAFAILDKVNGLCINFDAVQGSGVVIYAIYKYKEDAIKNNYKNKEIVECTITLPNKNKTIIKPLQAITPEGNE
jgi:hypothetical protein